MSASLVCAHTSLPVERQRTPYDCMTCALAMLTGRTYDEVTAAAVRQNADYSPTGPMSHSIMRCVAHEFGFMLVSSIYMLWTAPAIIGVLSPTIADGGHAILWDGEKLIDPGRSERVDRAYVDCFAMEFTQRIEDLRPLLADAVRRPAAGSVVVDDYF